MIDEATIAKAITLLQAAAPGAKVMLYGSYAAGTATDASDLDFLVVEPELALRRCEETAHLKSVLAPLGVQVDVLVIAQSNFDAWSKVPGAIVSPPASAGKPYPAIDFGVRIWSLAAPQAPPPARSRSVRLAVAAPASEVVKPG